MKKAIAIVGLSALTIVAAACVALVPICWFIDEQLQGTPGTMDGVVPGKQKHDFAI